MRNGVRKNTKINSDGNSADSGFSLVELLIAVTILAIIVIPLLHMFVTTTKINVKSRQMLRATTVAQDIMEGLKAYTLEEVRNQFEPPEGAGSGAYYYPKDGFYIVNSSMIRGGVQDLTADKGDEAKGIYCFGIENLKMQGGEYDALIELDASTYGSKAEEKQSGVDIEAHDNVFNGNFYAEIGSVAEVNGSGSETDSSYHEDKGLREAVLKDVKKQIEDDIINDGQALPDDWDEKELDDIITIKRRDIEITIKDAGEKDAAGNEQCDAEIKFTYRCIYNDNPDIHPGGYIVLAVGDIAEGEVKGIKRTFSSGNFYLFYYPIYSSTDVVDHITFKLDDTDKLFDEEHPLLKSIVVAKQIRSDVDPVNHVIAPELPRTGPGSLEEKEASYRVEVDIQNESPNLLFRTNLSTNLATGEDVVLSNVRIGSGLAQICTFTGDTASDKTTNVIYDIKITVYKAGAAQYFTESNFEDRDDVHKLATITSLEQEE